MQERRLGELEDVREAGAGHGCQAAAMQAGDGGQQVKSELRDVKVGFGEEGRQLDEHRLKVRRI